jgi:hypothetical protein
MTFAATNSGIRGPVLNLARWPCHNETLFVRLYKIRLFHIPYSTVGCKAWSRESNQLVFKIQDLTLFRYFVTVLSRLRHTQGRVRLLPPKQPDPRYSSLNAISIISATIARIIKKSDRRIMRSFDWIVCSSTMRFLSTTNKLSLGYLAFGYRDHLHTLVIL